jgi:hypothetical protein
MVSALSVIDDLKKSQKTGQKSPNTSQNVIQDLRRSQGLDRTASDVVRNIAGYTGETALNFPKDLVFGVGADTLRGLASPVSTAKGLASIVTQLPTLLPGIEGDDAELQGVGQYIQDSYGSVDAFLESFKEKPATTLADLSIVLGGIRAGTKIPQVAKSQVAKKTGEIAGATADFIDPITTLRKGGAVTGKFADATARNLGTAIQASGTGAPKQALDIARTVGATNKDFKKGESGKVSQLEIVKDAERAFDAKRTDINNKLNAASQSARLSSIPADARMTQGVVDAVDATFAKYTSQTDRFLLKDVELKHLNQVIKSEVMPFFNNPKAQNALGLQEIIRGLDRQFPSNTSRKAEARAVHSELRNNIRQVLEDHPDIPNDYKRALSEFSDGQKILDNARTELGLGKKTGSKKTVFDKIKGTFLEEGGISETALRQLPGSDKIINKMAGKLVSDPVPSQFLRVSAGLGGGTGFLTGLGGGFLLGGGLPAAGLGGLALGGLGFGATISPRFASEIQKRVGSARRGLTRFGQSDTANALRTVAPLARLSGTFQDEVLEPIDEDFIGLTRGLL